MERASVRDTHGYLPIVKTLFRRSFPLPNRYSKKRIATRRLDAHAKPSFLHLQIELHAYLLV